MHACPVAESKGGQARWFPVKGVHAIENIDMQLPIA